MEKSEKIKQARKQRFDAWEKERRKGLAPLLGTVLQYTDDTTWLLHAGLLRYRIVHKGNGLYSLNGRSSLRPLGTTVLSVLPHLEIDELQFNGMGYGIEPRLFTEEQYQFQCKMRGCPKHLTITGECPIELRQFAPVLKTLHLKKMDTLPTWIGELKNLVKLSISNSPKLNELPLSIFRLSKLVSLIIEDSSCTSLPSQIGHLSNLKTLHIANTPLDSLPTSIDLLTNIETVTITGTKIKALPEAVWGWRTAKKINLSDNQLEYVSPHLFLLPSLQALYLTKNPLYELTDTVQSPIKYLYINDTRITTLPPIDSLTLLRAANTPLENFKPEHYPELIDYELH